MIKGYTALTGGGKTLSLTMDANNWHKKYPNRKIYSNFHLKLEDGIEPISYYKIFGIKTPFVYEYKDKWYYPEVLKSDDFIDKLMTTKDGLFLVDEAGFVFNNRNWRKLPFDLIARFQQSRKVGVDIFYTTQAINRIDLTLRELTHLQVMCSIEKIPFTEKNFLLVNEAYFSPIIGHDSKENRLLYHAYTQKFPFFMFEKYYKMYDTLEIVSYSAVK